MKYSNLREPCCRSNTKVFRHYFGANPTHILGLTNVSGQIATPLPSTPIPASVAPRGSQGGKLHEAAHMHCMIFPVAVIAISMALPLNSRAEEHPLPVTVQPFRDISYHPTRSAPATVVSLNDSRLSSEIEGILLELAPRVGDELETGALIAAIDCTDHSLALTEAEARLTSGESELEFARFSYSRAKRLAESNTVSAELLNERETRFSQAQANVAQLESLVHKAKLITAKCEIRAPYRAVLIERLSSRGELLSPGVPVARILDLDHLEISAHVQRQDINDVRSAPSIRFAAGERLVPVRLRTVLPLLDGRRNSFNVRFDFADDLSLPPGESGRIEWELPAPHIPPEFVVRYNDTLGVFVNIQGLAKFLPLKGAQEGLPTPVTLQPDTSIVVDGRHTVVHNSSLNIIAE